MILVVDNPNGCSWQSSPGSFTRVDPGCTESLSQQLHPNYLQGLDPTEFSFQVRLVQRAVKFNNHVFSVVLDTTQNFP